MSESPEQGRDSRTPQERKAVEAHMAHYDKEKLYTSPAGHFLAGYRSRDSDVDAKDARIAALGALVSIGESELERAQAILRALLDTREAEAKAHLTLQTALDNYSNPEPEQLAFEKALIAASEAAKAARAYIGEKG